MHLRQNWVLLAGNRYSSGAASAGSELSERLPETIPPAVRVSPAILNTFHEQDTDRFG
jgi:hypothetical protein